VNPKATGGQPQQEAETDATMETDAEEWSKVIGTGAQTLE